MITPSKGSWRIAPRIARAPKRVLGAHTEWFCSMKVTIWQVYSRRDPSPGCVEHFHHHTTVALCDHPATRATSNAIKKLYIEHQGLWGASYAH